MKLPPQIAAVVRRSEVLPGSRPPNRVRPAMAPPGTVTCPITHYWCYCPNQNTYACCPTSSQALGCKDNSGICMCVLAEEKPGQQKA